jgi:hypothetical protein
MNDHDRCDLPECDQTLSDAAVYKFATTVSGGVKLAVFCGREHADQAPAPSREALDRARARVFPGFPGGDC